MHNIMRYLDKQKFEWLIADNGLYVSAAEDQDDSSEGMSDHTFLSRHLANTVEGIDPSLLTQLDELMLSSQQIDRERNYLSCWYLGTDETEKMWEEFGKDGIVMFSNESALMSSFPEPLEHGMSCYPVIYDDDLKNSALHEPLRVKHYKYHLQREFRIVFSLSKYSVLTGFEGTGVRDGDQLSHQSSHITQCMSQKGREQALKVIRRKNRGFVLNCSFGSAIYEVRAHPQATDEELNDIKMRLQSIGLRCEVKHSQLWR
ncbi:hypothetical protein PS673_02038 [Pseudomonas fluorescens]|jgi:hypothetical protein|uniref:DUF2971 domain-containing protein n=1 Tax=Pseudomonas fluorescens TaxID=294 RepID=A0A5E6S697_PSEFL|nr:hypothetical protein [Pseudomonas fluorescens]VVM76257.1 hypothetical protein PS673_02038 [Pseudomonas fluorescens]